jgi:hypothetical protein
MSEPTYSTRGSAIQAPLRPKRPSVPNQPKPEVQTGTKVGTEVGRLMIRQTVPPLTCLHRRMGRMGRTKRGDA